MFWHHTPQLLKYLKETFMLWEAICTEAVIWASKSLRTHLCTLPTCTNVRSCPFEHLNPTVKDHRSMLIFTASVRLVLARWILGVITHTWTQLFLSRRPRDGFAAVSLRFMTPYPVCEKAISAAFNSLFPMITRRIYHTHRAASGCVLVYVCVFGWESVRGVSSPGDRRKYISVQAGGERRTRRDSFDLFSRHRRRETGPTCLHRREVL